MEIFLYYLYTEKLPINTSNNQIFELIKLLIRYELVILLKNMENYIEIDENNVIECLELCDESEEKLSMLKTVYILYFILFIYYFYIVNRDV